MRASISLVEVIRLRLIGLEISLLSNFKATNLLILFEETRNTLITDIIDWRSLFERDFISVKALHASKIIISCDLCT